MHVDHIGLGEDMIVVRSAEQSRDLLPGVGTDLQQDVGVRDGEPPP